MPALTPRKTPYRRSLPKRDILLILTVPQYRHRWSWWNRRTVRGCLRQLSQDPVFWSYWILALNVVSDTENGLRPSDQLDVQLLLQFSLTLQELRQNLVVDAVRRKELVLWEGALVGEGNWVYLSIFSWVFQLHNYYSTNNMVSNNPWILTILFSIFRARRRVI